MVKDAQRIDEKLIIIYNYNIIKKIIIQVEKTEYVIMQ